MTMGELRGAFAEAQKVARIRASSLQEVRASDPYSKDGPLFSSSFVTAND